MWLMTHLADIGVVPAEPHCEATPEGTNNTINLAYQIQRRTQRPLIYSEPYLPLLTTLRLLPM
jgi:hypothetical protein